MKKQISIVLAISMVMSMLFLSAFSAGAESVLDTAKKWEINKAKSITLGSEGENDFKIILKSKGELKITINSYADYTYVYLYNSKGDIIEYTKRGASSGTWRDINPGKNALSYSSMEYDVLKGYHKYDLEAGTYYIRLTTFDYCIGEKCSISTSFTSTDSKASSDALSSTIAASFNRLLVDGGDLFYTENGYKYDISNPYKKTGIMQDDDRYRFITIEDDWIYYGYGKGLYKIRKNGTEHKKLSSGRVTGLATYDGYVYFLRNQFLYKVKTNGSDLQKLVDVIVENFYIYNNYIYCNTRNIVKGRFSEEMSGLYSVKLDGSNMKKLGDNNNIHENFYFNDGWIYYCVQGEAIYKMKPNGTSKKLVIAGDMHEIKGLYADNIYYSIFGEGDGVTYSVKTDGLNKKIFSSKIDKLVCTDEWLYCTTYDECVFRVKPDGTKKRLLSNTQAKNLTIVGNKMYYIGRVGANDCGRCGFSGTGWHNHHSLYEYDLEKMKENEIEFVYSRKITVYGY